MHLGGKAATDTERPDPAGEVHELVHALHSGDILRRLEAISRAGSLGSPAIGPLHRVLNEGDASASWGAALALVRVGTPALDCLIATFSSAAPGSVPAMWAAGKIGDARSVAALAGVLAESPEEVHRVVAASALRAIGHPAGCACVEEALGAHDAHFARSLATISWFRGDRRYC
ncbi:hypothetical protein AZH53_10010 [Methanomicrobiaceae archaeon CYW5]|nr:hypothetical protein [Methanovulcanius yangii]